MSAADIARMLATNGKPQEGLQALARFPEDALSNFDLGILGLTLAKAGRTDEARAIAKRLAARAAAVPSAAVGATFVFMGLGDLDTAVDFGISAARRGTVSYIATPDFDPLRTHRRYPELLRALGLHDQPIARWDGKAPAAGR